MSLPKVLHGIRILLVEDDLDCREALSFALALAGASVLAVALSSEAIEAFPVFRPDVLVSDIGLPDETGLRLIRLVRDQHPGQRGGLPAIALTGFAVGEVRPAALDAGYDRCLAMPVDVRELIQAVSETVHEGHATDVRETRVRGTGRSREPGPIASRTFTRPEVVPGARDLAGGRETAGGERSARRRGPPGRIGTG